MHREHFRNWEMRSKLKEWCIDVEELVDGPDLPEEVLAIQLMTGIKKTGTSNPLAVFLRFLRLSAPGASGFLSPFSYGWHTKR